MENKSCEYYYRHNKIFMNIIGLWIYQGTISKYFFTLSTIIFGGSQVILQTGGMISAAHEDVDVFLEAIAPVVVNGFVIPKFINFMYNKKKMMLLYKEVENDWNTFKQMEEVEILKTYASKTEKLCLIYAGSVYGGMTPVLLLPTIPAILEAFGLIHQTGPKILPFPVQYLVDIDKYYYHVIFDAFMGSFFLVMIVVAVDTMFILYIHHACSIFKIIGYRLNNIIVKNDSNYNNVTFKDGASYQRIRSCVKLHSKVLKFADFIENTNTTGFLVMLVFNIAGVTFTGFQTVMLLDRPSESFRYLTFTLAQLSHLYFQSSPPQRLFDHSINISNDANNGLWYETSNRTRKCMIMLIMRTLKPCTITAGKLSTLNIQNFSNVLRTCMQYFTVLSSQR